MAQDKVVRPFLALASPENKFTIDTIADMQSMKYLKIGDVVELNGYYTAGDGAGHKRIISATDDGSGVQLANGLWANIVHNGEVNVSWFGAKGDGVTDDTLAIQKAILATAYKLNMKNNMFSYVEAVNLNKSFNIINPKGDYIKIINCNAEINYINDERLEKMPTRIIAEQSNLNIENLIVKNKYIGITNGNNSVLRSLDSNIKVKNLESSNITKLFKGVIGDGVECFRVILHLVSKDDSNLYISKITAKDCWSVDDSNVISDGDFDLIQVAPLSSYMNSNNVTNINTVYCENVVKRVLKIQSGHLFCDSFYYVNTLDTLPDTHYVPIDCISGILGNVSHLNKSSNTCLISLVNSQFENRNFAESRISINTIDIRGYVKYILGIGACEDTFIGDIRFAECDRLIFTPSTSLLNPKLSNIEINAIQGNRVGGIFISNFVKNKLNSVTVHSAKIDYIATLLPDHCIDVSLSNCKFTVDVIGGVSDYNCVRFFDSILNLDKDSKVFSNVRFSKALASVSFINSEVYENILAYGTRLFSEVYLKAHSTIFETYNPYPYGSFGSGLLGADFKDVKITNKVADISELISIATGDYTFDMVDSQIIGSGKIIFGSKTNRIRGIDFENGLKKNSNKFEGLNTTMTVWSDVRDNIRLIYTSTTQTYIDITTTTFNYQPLNTPYHATKMQQEGVYDDFIQYMDEKTEYDRLQREQPDGVMMLPVVEEPQPSEALLRFKEKYLG